MRIQKRRSASWYADQLRGNHEADQRLCFRYTDSTIPLLPKFEIRNPEDRFPHNEAHLSHPMRKPAFCICEKRRRSAVLSAFVFATYIVQSLYSLNLKFQDSISCRCTVWFQLGQVKNKPKTFFSRHRSNPNFQSKL